MAVHELSGMEETSALGGSVKASDSEDRLRGLRPHQEVERQRVLELAESIWLTLGCPLLGVREQRLERARQLASSQST